MLLLAGNFIKTILFGGTVLLNYFLHNRNIQQLLIFDQLDVFLQSYLEDNLCFLDKIVNKNLLKMH